MYARISEQDYILIRRLESGTAIEKRFAEIFKEVLIDLDFRDFVSHARKRLKIPENGISNDRRSASLLDKCLMPGGITDGQYVYRPYISLDELCVGYDNAIDEFLEKKSWYGLDRKYYYHNFYSIGSLSFAIREYILTGDVVPSETEMACISRTFHKESDLEEMKKDPKLYEEMKKDGIASYVTDESIEISFSPHVTKKELIEYIESNWRYVQELKTNILGKIPQRRIKSRKNFFRDLYIFQKYEEFKKTIQPGEYAEIKVGTFLRKEYGMNLEDGTIRSIVSRTRKLVSNKKG
ncbi:MAG: hypothetical protein HYV45_02175 [Candidatus Moranbacteria bacterium]|nr:hypothetical protein [Candidatus Moranbacteria bacterium]